MALAQHADDDGAHQLALADDDLPDLVLDGGDLGGELLWAHHGLNSVK